MKTTDRLLLPNRLRHDDHPPPVDQSIRHATQAVHIHVLVAEDNFDLAGTAIDCLEVIGVVCDHARDGQAGLNLVHANHYDVILLNIMLSRIDGRQVCRQPCKAGLQTPVLILTTPDTLQDRLDGFDTSADGYLLKPFELPELLIRLQALSRRRSGQAQRLRVNDLVMDFDSRQASRDDMPLALSPTAWRILECLMRVNPALVTHEQLGYSVRGDEPPESNTPNIHMRHLRNTVNKGFATSLIHTLHSVGFQLERG